MIRPPEPDYRSGPRYLVSFEVRAEWDEEDVQRSQRLVLDAVDPLRQRQ